MEGRPSHTKRKRGVYYTTSNPFALEPFREWCKEAGIAKARILEPFAGSNNIVRMLSELGLCARYQSYDIAPKAAGIKKRDTIKSFPSGYRVCVTNPPWLTSYSARRRGVEFVAPRYDNLYKYCLELALANCEYVAFIMPGTFLRTGLFRERLKSVIFLHGKIFAETDNPVCIALFGGHQKNTKVYNDNRYLGTLQGLESHMPPASNDGNVRFNDPAGQIGLYCIDNTRGPSIRFCRGSEITRRVKHSDRLITRIAVPHRNPATLVGKLNKELDATRRNTHDVFFAPFKGLRKDGKYRRRIDYEFVRNLIANA